MKAAPSARLRLFVALLAAWLAAPGFAAPAETTPGADAPPAPRKAKPAVDDRADPNLHASEVGKGTHYARKPLGQGAYFNNRSRAAVRSFFAAHPDKARPAGTRWQIGEALPADAAVHPVPGAIASKLPKVPPGLRYLQVGSDVLLVANGTHMVVDGINGVPAR